MLLTSRFQHTTAGVLPEYTPQYTSNMKISVSESVSGNTYPKYPSILHYAYNLVEYIKILNTQDLSNRNVESSLKELHARQEYSLPYPFFVE